MQHAKSYKILDFISSILIVSAIILFFMPTLKEFDQTLSIITISIGLLLLTLGLFLKLFIWQRINNKKIKNTGMGFTSGLTLLFIALKLTGYIDWSWIWVISPIWIVILLLFVLFAIVMIGGQDQEGKMVRILLFETLIKLFIVSLVVEYLNNEIRYVFE